MTTAVATAAPADSVLLTDPEAAAFLKVADGTLAVWRCTGRHALPYCRIGRSIRYRLSDLQRFVENSVVNAAQADVA